MEIWDEQVLLEMTPDPHAATFQVLVNYDSLYPNPWLLATLLPLTPARVKAIYPGRWPVEQIPLAAT